MSYEELVKSGKSIGEMNEDELLEYSYGLLHEVWDYEKKINKKEQEIERLNNIINELEKYCNEVIEETKSFINTWDKAERRALEQVIKKLKELKEKK